MNHDSIKSTNEQHWIQTYNWSLRLLRHQLSFLPCSNPSLNSFCKWWPTFTAATGCRCTGVSYTKEGNIQLLYYCSSIARILSNIICKENKSVKWLAEGTVVIMWGNSPTVHKQNTLWPCLKRWSQDISRMKLKRRRNTSCFQCLQSNLKGGPGNDSSGCQDVASQDNSKCHLWICLKLLCCFKPESLT